MLTISNTLSFIRAPLAFLFLHDSPVLRLTAIILAMFTDSIDGYLARRSRSTSRFGAFLDPAADKFFVYFALMIFYFEARISPWEISTMLSRDFFLILYGFFMIVCGRRKGLEFHAVRWGKVTTALQFLVLVGLTLHIAISWMVYASFTIMGFLAFIELLQISNPFVRTKIK